MTPTYTLQLQPTPRPDDPEGTRRLRAALKCLLRSFGLRCVTIAKVETQPSVSVRCTPDPSPGLRVLPGQSAEERFPPPSAGS
jgi:hypothetical protein